VHNSGILFVIIYVILLRTQ